MGANLLAPAGSRPAFPHRSLLDGEEVDLGGLALRVLATPGHTPEHLAFLLVDGTRPVGLLSGGALLAGGVARTDLLGSEQTEPLARAAYRSLHARLLTLPDGLPVYPTHGGGSFCAASSTGDRTTTIGRERASNPLLAGAPDEDTFVARLLAGFGSYPPYFLELRDVNRAGPAVHGPKPPALPRLSLPELDDVVREGAEIVDVRSIEAFAAGHVPGALSIPWRPQFATWLGWLVPRARPVVFVADGGVERDDLVWAALAIGFERLSGELSSGMDAWTRAGRRVERTPLVDAEAARGRTVVDVRQRAEFDAGHARQALHVELGTLAANGDKVLGGALLLHCGHGERAMTGASLLQRSGHRDVAVLLGGPNDLEGEPRSAQP